MCAKTVEWNNYVPPASARYSLGEVWGALPVYFSNNIFDEVLIEAIESLLREAVCLT